MTISKNTLFWLAISTLPMMPFAKFVMGTSGIYLMIAFGIAFIALWKTYPKDRS